MRLFILLLALFTSLTQYSFSQNDTTAKKVNFILKTDLFFPVIGIAVVASGSGYLKSASLTFETCFKQKHSLQITACYYYFDYENSHPRGFESIRVQDKSFQIIPEYKIFLHEEKNHSGGYYGANLKFINYTYSNEYI